MRSPWANRRVAIVLGIGILATLIDQLSKQVALTTLAPYLRVDVLGQVLGWKLVFNDSAAFSLGFGITWIFTAFSSLALLALLWYCKNIESNSWAVLAGFLLGGITGNLIDRCFRSPGFPNGSVIDFIQIPFGFPIFNIADCCISITMLVVAIRIARGDQIGKTNKQHTEGKS